jgi:hypothetical protein
MHANGFVQLIFRRRDRHRTRTRGAVPLTRTVVFVSTLWFQTQFVQLWMPRLQLLVTLLPALALSGMRRADRAALVSFYNLLGGPHWLNSDGWHVDDPTSDPCDPQTRWRGVGCIDPCDSWIDGPDCAFGRVTALNLRSNNLTGSITNWTGIGDLHNLTWLDLSFNSISGSLPAEIGEIQNIAAISLKNNHLEGQIPDAIGNINSNGNEKLSELNMERNSLQGTLPSSLGRHDGLLVLQLGFNRISGTIPAQLTNLTVVQVLHLQSNRLEGTIPEDLGQMIAMRYLNLTTNNISGTLPPSIGNMQDLADLSLSENRLTGSVPLEIGSLSTLRHLRMHNNALNGNLTALSTLGGLRSLLTFDLYANHMHGDVPPSIQDLVSLQYLYLDNQHYGPLRQYYCGQRIPNNGKYNYRIVRDEYLTMTSTPCDNMYDTNFAFSSLQESGVYAL